MTTYADGNIFIKNHFERKQRLFFSTRLSKSDCEKKNRLLERFNMMNNQNKLLCRTLVKVKGILFDIKADFFFFM